MNLLETYWRNGFSSEIETSLEEEFMEKYYKESKGNQYLVS